MAERRREGAGCSSTALRRGCVELGSLIHVVGLDEIVCGAGRLGRLDRGAARTLKGHSCSTRPLVRGQPERQNRETSGKPSPTRVEGNVAVETRWRAAFVQGVAVLLGILVAFAIDAAWESRSDRLATAAYLESLNSELEANREEFEAWIEQIDFSIQRNERFLVDLVVDGSETVSQDSVRSMHRTLAPLSVNPPRRAAFDELVQPVRSLITPPEIVAANRAAWIDEWLSAMSR